MGIFGRSKEDKSQTDQINKLWKFVTALDKNVATVINNQNILIKNNSYFIKALKQLQQKDKLHDAKDTEIETMIQGFKAMAKAIETSEAKIE